MVEVFFSWDDGAIEDFKLAALHEKYSIPAILFVPNWNTEGRKVLSKNDIKKIRNSLISIGGHTVSHRYLTAVAKGEVSSEILHNKEYLENILGEEIHHFCFPGGKYNKEIAETALLNYDTVRTADTMNCHKNTCIIKPTFHIYPRNWDSMLYNCIKNKNITALKYISKVNSDYMRFIKSIILDYSLKKDNYKMIVWGHSWEIEALNLWEDLENLMKFIKSNNIKVSDYNQINR